MLHKNASHSITTWRIFVVTKFANMPGFAAIIEVGFVYTVKLPVEPMLFRLLRVGKLIRAIRMVTWSKQRIFEIKNT